ncbi:hypothetical protein MXB_79 [Myxobolus squamalis]|nr:hypothetical protein MXB_79 [Myxobolus squamalis]
MSKYPSTTHQKLFKHILRCYCRIIDHDAIGRLFVERYLPNEILDDVFFDIMGDDDEARDMMNTLEMITQTKRKYYMQEHFLYRYKLILPSGAIK